MVSDRYRYFVFAHSPRDGGWVRVFESFKSENDALTAVELFRPLMQLSDDYDDIQIVKTIVFKARCEDRRRRV